MSQTLWKGDMKLLWKKREREKNRKARRQREREKERDWREREKERETRETEEREKERETRETEEIETEEIETEEREREREREREQRRESSQLSCKRRTAIGFQQGWSTHELNSFTEVLLNCTSYFDLHYRRLRDIYWQLSELLRARGSVSENSILVCKISWWFWGVSLYRNWS